MLDTIDTARAELESAIAELDRLSADQADQAQGEARSQLRTLGRLREQLASGPASGSAAALRAEVTAAVAAIHFATQEARSATAAAQAAPKDAEIARLHAEAHATAMSVATDIFDRRIFDEYLEFDSDKDADEYRRREAERHAEIERLLALNTPEATLQANRLLREQLLDAKAHGADRSPDFQPLYDRVLGARDDLKEAGVGQSVSEPQIAQDDPFKSVRPVLDSDLMAQLAAAGIQLPDQDGTGPGIHFRPAVIPDRGNTPT